MSEETAENTVQGEKSTVYVDFSKSYTVKSKHLGSFNLASPGSADGDYKYQHAQGGVAIGNYLYTFMHAPNQSPERCCIYKQDLKRGRVVGHSEELQLGHANDATYNPDENTIVVSYCDGSSKMAILDADTLEWKKDVLLKGKVLCNIDYDPVSQIYVAASAQCDMIYVYDKDFKLIRQFEGFMSKGELVDYSMQGCITDGTYIYVLEWHGGKKWAELKGAGGATTASSTSHFNVFDLHTGEHVGVIDLGIPREVEYASYVDGKFYIGCNNISWNGLEVYQVEIVQ